MRRLILFIFLISIPIGSLAAKPMTVAQLQELLAAAVAEHQSDDAVARQLAGVKLTARLTGAPLQQLIAASPGPITTQTLHVIADDSAFLDPSPDEIPATPAPDIATQKAMLSRTVSYIAHTMPALPNFLASRVTEHYAGSLLGLPSQTQQPRGSMFFTGTFSVPVAFRDGKEIHDMDLPDGTSAPAKKSSSKSAASASVDTGMIGMTSWGEFGPILSVVLIDASKGKLSWARWGSENGKPVAVFQFTVERSASHYVMNYCCVTSLGLNDTPEVIKAGYHGTFELDPDTGTVLRITVVSDLRPEDSIRQSSMMVEYGTVDIGGHNYFCPVRSVSTSVSRAELRAHGEIESATRLLLNDVSFTGYRRFGSTARIFAGSPSDEAPPTSDPTAPPSPAEAGTTPAPPVAQQPAPSTSESSAPAPPAPSSPALSSPVPSPPAEPVNAVLALPLAPDATQAEQESLLRQMPVLKSNSREVVVDVVVTKSNGDPVIGLTKQDFDVKEDGKPQSLDFFEEHTAKNLSEAKAQPLPSLPPNVYTNTPPAPESDAVNVLLLDSLNTPKQDQSRVHLEIIDFFKKMQPGTRVAIFMLGSQLRFLQGFTTDTSVLLAKLKGTEPQKDSSFHDRSDQADDAADAQRLAMMMGPFAGAGSTAGAGARAAAQAEVANVGYGERASMTFEALNYLARYLAGVPGRKNLIWFSSTFPVVIFPNLSQRQELANLHGYLGEVKRTADLFTISKVAVYPIGVEGVMEEHIMEADTAGPASPEGPSHVGAGGNIIGPYTAGAGERAGTIAAMEQLAADTGGKAYFNTNDINGAMRRAINDGANYYSLSYSPTNKKMDGEYRRVEVHIPTGHYKLSYRRGYNADDLPAVEANPNVDPLQPLLKFGLPSESGLLYGVRILPASPQPDADAPHAGQSPDLKSPLTRYTVDFFIRWTDVGFDVSQRGDHTGKIQVALMAYDRDGKPLNWDSVTQSMNINPATFDAIQKSGVPAHMEIDLPSSAAFLISGVYDWSTGKTGTLHTPVNAAEATLPKTN